MAEEQAKKSQSPRQSQQHLAPDNSPEHRDVRKAAEEAGQDVETLRNILWLINAHDRLLGLRQIADNLLQILKSRKQGNDLAIFRGWPEVLRWIVEFHKGSESSEDPIRNRGLQRHPLYDCLWHRTNGWIERYVALQWHLLWAHASYLYGESLRDDYEAYGENEEWAAFPNSPYVATLNSWFDVNRRRFDAFLAPR